MRALLAGPLLMGCLASDSTGTGVGPPAVVVTITTAPGETLAFVPAESTVSTAGAIALSFRNRSSLTHNLVFTGPVSAGTETIVEQGADDELLLAPLPPGTHPFVCTIHDGMTGVLVVESP